MNSNIYWCREPQISVCLEGDNGILFDPDTGREKVINATGLVVWHAMNGQLTSDALAEELANECGVDKTKQILEDVSAFADELFENGFAETALTTRPEPVEFEEYSRIEDAPRDFDLSLTGRCNLHCDYCFYADEMVGRRDLSADRWLVFFEELKSLAVRNVTLSGGEVFMRPDLWELIDGVVESRMRYSILSNGTLIDENCMHAFEKGYRYKRLNSIQISIDGSCSEVHDKSRGKGSFDRAIRGLRLLKEARFPVTVRVTVNRYNVNDLDNIAMLLLDDIGLPRFSANDAMPMGSGCDNLKTISLTPQQQITAMKTLARLADQYHGRVTASAGPLAKWRSYREMAHARATGEMAKSWKMGYLTACGCVYTKLSAHHDGAITPCNILSRLVLGYINENQLADIWKLDSTLKALKERRGITMAEVPGCEDCEWAPFCNGSCPGLAHEMTGDFNLANPYDCYRRFLQITGGADVGYEN